MRPVSFVDKLDTPGEHHEIFVGKAGNIALILDVPPNADRRYLAVLGHPHSLQGGTMNNKVVTTMARVFRQLGITSIRFDFRGVGQSAGMYDSGIGESEDMLDIVSVCDRPELTVFFAGFSFGSYVAFRALCAYQTQYAHRTALISIAPPVHHYDYTPALAPNTPWLVVQGLADEVVPEALVTDFVQLRHPSPHLEYFADTGHFFHGKLIELKSLLLVTVESWMAAE